MCRGCYTRTPPGCWIGSRKGSIQRGLGQRGVVVISFLLLQTVVPCFIHWRSGWGSGHCCWKLSLIPESSCSSLQILSA